MLPEDKRKQLDSIVLDMGRQNAPQADVQAIVNDFKSKYDVADQQPQEQKPQTALDRFKESFAKTHEKGIEGVKKYAKENVQARESGDIYGTAKSAFMGVGHAVESTVGAAWSGAFGAAEPAIKSLGESGKEIGENISDLTPDIIENYAKGMVKRDYESTKKFFQLGWDYIPEKAQKEIADIAMGSLKISEAFGTAALFKKGVQKLPSLLKKGRETGKKVIADVAQIPKGTESLVDTAIEIKAKSAKLKALKKSEKIAKKSPVSLKEEIVGIPEAYKNQFKGKQPLVDEYIEVTKAANKDLTKPSATSHAVQKSSKAMDELEKQLNSSGSDLGSFRKKIPTYKAKPEQIQTSISALDKSVVSQGLVVKNGKYVPSKSRVPNWNPAEIKQINDLRTKLVQLKGDPKLQRIIDMRKIADDYANFELEPLKPRRTLDLPAKKVRSNLAQTMKDIVGSEQSAIAEEYYQTAQLIKDFRTATSSGKNYEFLLKKVLSERDAIPKAIIESIKKRTGIDLLDEASASRMITELMGSNSQKSLLNQTIQSAGLGSVKGQALGVAGKFLKKKLVDTEKVLRKVGGDKIAKPLKKVNSLNKTIEDILSKRNTKKEQIRRLTELLEKTKAR